MKVDLLSSGGNWAQEASLARQAEQVGFAGILYTEMSTTPFQRITAAALATERLELCTGIAVGPVRSPMVMAQIAWELAANTNGRFRLGIGPQVKAHVERRYGMPYDPPGPRLRDYVKAVRACFSAFANETKLNHDGPFYKLSLLPATWSPGPLGVPAPKVDISAVGPWMVRMAGAEADGIHVHPFHSRQYIDRVLLPTVAGGASEAGRSPEAVELIIPVFTIVGDSEAERAPLRARARQQIAFYGSTKNYAFQFDDLGFDGTSARINERLKAGDTEGMASLISDDMLAHYAIEASWDEMSDRLVERYHDVARRLVLYFAAADWVRNPASLDRWGEVVRDVQQRTGH